jgi:hypothetical protein
MGQDLFHVCALIGINDKLNISVKSINVKYRFCRYRLDLWPGATLGTSRWFTIIALVNALEQEQAVGNLHMLPPIRI